LNIMLNWLGFERQVAIRFLREGRIQTVLIIVGVAAGVAVFAYISALVVGLQSNTLEKTLGTQAHITLSALDDVVISARVPAQVDSVLVQTQPRGQKPRSVGNWQALIPVLQALPKVIAVSPMISVAGLAVRGEAAKSISLTGVELDPYDHIVKLRSKVVLGQARLGPGEGMIGRDLAKDLGVGVGDRISIVTDGVSDSLRITALVDMGVRELNRRTVIVPLRAAQSLAGLPGGATSLEMAVADIWAAPSMAADMAHRWPYKIEHWQQTNAQILSALDAQSVSTKMIRGVVLLVVALGIASVLVVSVVQKRREIGILRAMGATRGQVLRIFLLQGTIVGLLGSALGILLTFGLIWVFTTFVRGSDGMSLFVITLTPGLAFSVASIATLCGVLAAVMPARSAAALDPAQAIRI
jgi:lipoprotein-releasing system permease protein